jgi:hypothetical protein
LFIYFYLNLNAGGLPVALCLTGSLDVAPSKGFEPFLRKLKVDFAVCFSATFLL